MCDIFIVGRLFPGDSHRRKGKDADQLLLRGDAHPTSIRPLDMEFNFPITLLFMAAFGQRRCVVAEHP